MVGPVYGLGTNIASLYRISPRVIYNSGKMRFALEFEYTVANYGSTRDAKRCAYRSYRSSKPKNIILQRIISFNTNYIS